MEMGTHDPVAHMPTGWPLVDLARNPDPSEYADQVSTADGGVISAVLAARGDQGWEADADRDSKMAMALSHLVKGMDSLADDYEAGKVSAENTGAQAVHLWRAIRTITRGEGGR